MACCSIRELLQILLSHDLQEAGGARQDSEMRMAKRGGGENASQHILQSWNTEERVEGKQGKKEEEREFSWDSSIHCCSIATVSFHSSTWGHKELANLCHLPSWIPLFTISSTRSHTNTHLSEDVMSQTWRGENLHFSFPCVSKVTCRFTWEWAHPSGSVQCTATLGSVYILANRQIMSVHLNMLVCAFVRPCTRLLEIWHEIYRRGFSAASGTVRHGA